MKRPLIKDSESENGLNIDTEQLVTPAVTQARSSWARKASVLLHSNGLDKFQVQCVYPAKGPGCQGHNLHDSEKEELLYNRSALQINVCTKGTNLECHKNGMWHFHLDQRLGARLVLTCF